MGQHRVLQPPTAEEHVARTPQEVFRHHAEALGAEDIDAIVSDYADDAIFMTPGGVLRGKDGVRAAFEKLTSEVPGADWELPNPVLRGRRPVAGVEGHVSGFQGRGRDRHVRVSRRSDPRPDRALLAAANMGATSATH
jgi:hypothetical protein